MQYHDDPQRVREEYETKQSHHKIPKREGTRYFVLAIGFVAVFLLALGLRNPR
jgi:hypothetical protein